MMDVSAILTGTNLLLASGIFVLITVLRVPFKSIFESRNGQRFLPLLPLVLGVVGALLGACSNCSTWQEKVLIGLLAGFASSHFFKLGKTTVFGWGLPEPIVSAEPDKVADEPAKPAEPTKVAEPANEPEKAAEPEKAVEPAKEPDKVAVPSVAADVITKPEKATRVRKTKKK
jgi:outer membrane biosynthesis protein TonB